MKKGKRMGILRPSQTGLEGRFGVAFWGISLLQHCAGVSWPDTKTQLPAIKPQVADTVTSLARNARHHHSQNHSFSPSRMPRKSIMTKLPIWFDSLTTCRHDHNVWFIILHNSHLQVGCDCGPSKAEIFQENLLCHKCES